ncbi:MAG: hypothetical protein HC844_16030 [Tabrizicola sp.]|nr:hypothetical protein [Tabrizicola sp.]
MAQVWAVGFDDGYDVRVGLEFLDGDLWKTEYVDRTPDVLSSGWNFKTGEKRLGRALKPDNIPSKFRWGGAASRMPDIMLSHDVILVGDKVKSIIEALEPRVHQFFPLETWCRGNQAGPRMYLLNICNRLDSVDREKTTKQFVYEHRWKTEGQGELVFNLDQIGDHKLWHDKHIYDILFLADDVRVAFEAVNVTGVKYYGTPAV